MARGGSEAEQGQSWLVGNVHQEQKWGDLKHFRQPIFPASERAMPKKKVAGKKKKAGTKKAAAKEGESWTEALCGRGVGAGGDGLEEEEAAKSTASPSPSIPAPLSGPAACRERGEAGGA